MMKAETETTALESRDFGIGFDIVHSEMRTARVLKAQ